MSFDSIVNRGEYFSDHFFDTLLQTNLKALRTAWDAAEGKGDSTSRSRLRAINRSFGSARVRATESDDASALNTLALTALGFPDAAGEFEIERASKSLAIPTLCCVDTQTGTQVVAIDAGLASTLDELLAGTIKLTGGPQLAVDDAVTAMFVAAEPPRFVLLCGGSMMALADRFSWSEGKVLAVDLGVALERNDTKPTGELATIASLFSTDALVPTDGTATIDELRDASLKHAVGVSKELREGIRRSVELIADAVIQRRLTRNRPVYNVKDLPKVLTTESLRYLYRLLFLLFAESRRELGILPIDAPEYAEGYGLDRMRDLALTTLKTEKAQNGSHLYDSLQLLFTLVNNGSGTARQQQFVDEDERAEGSQELQFRALKSTLFSPKSTPTIDSVGLDNHTMQQVLQLLMLSKEKRGKDRGFVSYAQLGINQLGAVYEGLMAYTGFFASEDLIELHRPDKEDKGSWIAPYSRIGEYDNKMIKKVAKDHHGQPEPLIHRKGAFVFRLSGRDRQRSASYYTPEVLTRCVVKHSLAELLDQNGTTTVAADILALKICEPALGSGAFVNEAINQLAVEYLRRRQLECKQDIEPSKYIDELQKVKAHLALHQSYGVDLNPTAVELAEVSMWLNCMHEGLEAPWFGLHLRRGNSLIGAQRSVYTSLMLSTAGWSDTVALDRPLSAGPIKPGEVHQFLLPAHGWAAVGDAKEAKELRKDQAEARRVWRKALLKPLSAQHIDRLARMAGRVEALWALVVPTLEAAERDMRRPVGMWGAEKVASKQLSADAVTAMLRNESSPLGRLRLVMNAWCALWFWPVDGVQPPSMEQWLGALEGILGHGSKEPPVGQLDLFADFEATVQAAEALQFDSGQRLIAEVLDEHPWLQQASAIAEREGFWHWELEWAHIFASGGFDLQVGNPPWVRINWEDDVVLGEFEPWFGLTEKAPDAEIRKRRANVLAVTDQCQSYLAEVASAAGLTTILGSAVVHPVLKGVRSNLYMLFMEQVWRHASPTGIAGLLHPESHFTDPSGGNLRRETYRRLRRHFQFNNEAALFEEIHHMNTFGVQVYGHPHTATFMQLSHVQIPAMVDGSLEHDGNGPTPSIQYPAGGWDLRPHAERVVTVDTEVLASWAALFDDPGTPAEEARLLRPVTRADLATIETLAHFPTRLADLDYKWSAGWNETNAKQDGTMEWRTEVPSSWDEVILQGPHFTVATPISKQPNENCQHRQDYSDWNLEELPERVIPRTNYQRSCDRPSYDSRIDQWWGKPNTSFWRHVHREMTATGLVRSLHGAILQPGPMTVGQIAMSLGGNSRSTAVFSGLLLSLPYDYFVKLSGTGHLKDYLVRRFPVPLNHPLQPELLLRTLRLNCLTADYATLWKELFDPTWQADAWADAMAGRPALGDVQPGWTMATPLRTDYDRRLALVELDALAALMLGLSAEQLCAMYRTQFAVLRKYEYEMYFDANGRKIARDHHAHGQTQQKDDWESLVTALETDAPSFGRYQGPFYKADREAEMTHAYNAFTRRLADRH